MNAEKQTTGARGQKPKMEIIGSEPAAEPFIDKAEVAKRTQMKVRTVNDWMKRGLLPYYKVGRLVRFKWSEVEAHLAQTCRVCRHTGGTAR
jgi:excisionase family DNA binding protein